jgi:glycosyltransferase involved in cell wall biosynthesis
MSRRLRSVMLLSDGFGGFGGIAKFNRDFLTALSKSPLVAHLRALPRTMPEPVEADMPVALVYERTAGAGNWVYALRLLACVIRRERIDIVLCGHLNLLRAAWVVARLKGARLVLVIHGFEAWQPRGGLHGWLAGRIDELVSVSRLSAERFCAWSRFPLQRAQILPNCVDLERFHPQPKNTALLHHLGLGGGKVIMTVGRMADNERYKGFDEVIAIMPRLLARYPGLKYLIVGDGSDRARLQAIVSDAGLSGAVIFAGRIAEADKVSCYNLADAYVMPSRGEGFGIVLIEALACGLPVVGSSVDGSREALRGGELGRVVDPADSEALFAAVIAALHDGRRQPPAGLDLYSPRQFESRVSSWVEHLCRN